MHTTSLTPSTHTQVWRPGAEAIVDLGAIAHNVRVLREHAGSAQVMAVVKADAYGHGAVAAGRAAIDAGAAELGVATIDEALTLRQGGITAPVLAWLHPPGTDFAPAVTADVGVAVSSVHQVGAVLDAVERTGNTAEVTVKVDTGLNRNGVSAADYPALLTELQRAVAADAIRLRGIMSHLANGDVPDDPLNDLQAQRFTAMIAEARSRGIEFDVAHLSNSPSAMTRPDLAFDMVRPGIAVYGLSPIPDRGDMGLRPAMTLRCTVAMVKPVKAGDGVSYGHTWIAEQDTNLALLPIGYADGLYRTLGGRIEILINGRLRRSVGRVCMDQFVVDLGPGEPGVAAGDEAILFGPGTSGEQTAQDWADLLGTIHYEVVTSPRGRVVRTYREPGADGQ
ncbi:alanine racemase [Mycolicibacterium aichiense]|uniref:Alanine racemase n=1 Tax=Mycolicibacterium aichiense TaxID=1799 RepID=A0AAD1HKE4_9MYCO|nr:alanine racemase [Mycolicibacterium aichiense]MCV7019159.1 alanine racemase [Mycolicibacterium aichiense]BBX06309.1 alanine racemase [Mycolicibacterium aichiense]STZ24349.1 alanine racemase [Mycolicibacterium aichiense]